jgi:CRISPR-associated protein Cas1
MLKRTLFFTSPCHLSIRLSQLFIQRQDQEDRTIPLEDIAVLVLENPAITLTVACLQRLFEQVVVVVVCDAKHMPDALLLPSSANHVHAEVLRLQIEASLPLTKQLWRQTIQAKIRNQAELLERLDRKGSSRLRQMGREVKSDDADNREGVAARVYWQNLFGDPTFVREREGEAPNSLLNYGYAVLRAATARALVSSGLLCAIGIHHRNRYNPYGLADDIMEPYRPFVDQMVCDILRNGPAELQLTPEVKMKLLDVLACDTLLNGERSPLMVALSTTTASLVRCLRGEGNTELLYPCLR